MDCAARRLRRKEKNIELSSTEWDLLEFMLRNADNTLTRQKILDYVWSYDSNVRMDLVDVYISYLRQKIKVAGLIDPIQTVRGVGYRLDSNNA